MNAHVRFALFILLAAPLAAQSPEDFTGVRVQLGSCPEGLVSRTAVFLPQRPDASVIVENPACPDAVRIDVLWGQLPQRPEPGEPVSLVLLGRENGRPFLDSRRTRAPDREGKLTTLELQASLEVLSAPSTTLATPSTVSLTLGTGSAGAVDAWHVWGVRLEDLGGEDPAADDFERLSTTPLPAWAFRDGARLSPGEGTWVFALQPVVEGLSEQGLTLEGEPFLSLATRDLRVAGSDWKNDALRGARDPGFRIRLR